MRPNQVSIADPDALQVLYSSTSGALKSDMYNSLVQFGGTPSSLATRSREDHARKRKFIAPALSMRSILEYQPVVSKYQQLLVHHWDRMCADAKEGKGGRAGAQIWTAGEGRAWFDCMPWFNLVAFDTIGDLAFGSGFGMAARGTDVVQVATNQADAVQSLASEKRQLKMKEIPLVETILDRSEYTTARAFLPAWARPLLLLVPNLNRGSQAMETFGTLAVTSILKRLARPSDRVDLLSKMLEAGHEAGMAMDRKEICAEATLLLIAGSDTTSNSTCAMIYYLARDLQKQRSLQQELDAVLGPPHATDTFEGHDSLYERVKSLPYLEAVLNEGLRLYTVVGSGGLPRVVPKGGLTMAGHTFTEGTVVSVPLNVVHKDPSVWGNDVHSFRPERWLEGDKAVMQKAFAPFSIGPRACVGRNLAVMVMTTVVATLAHRYEFVLQESNQELKVFEGIVRRPLGCTVGIRRRDQA